jgi:hypothetical protein
MRKAGHGFAGSVGERFDLDDLGMKGFECLDGAELYAVSGGCLVWASM